ncbi:unnamed protein product [Paramecium primaurelia]|uniref:Uncharacterized protein n=1 Tax=Paramecium primaurelia TaxID=5886 RepID=A0A8S1M4A2_PARPR|nr:unnamed protein product [Paramecium primaurelia]
MVKVANIVIIYLIFVRLFLNQNLVIFLEKWFRVQNFKEQLWYLKQMINANLIVQYI